MNKIVSYLDGLEEVPGFATDIAGNSLARWVVALGFFLLLYISVRVILSLSKKVVTSAAKRSHNSFDDVLIPVFGSIKLWIICIASICVALKSLSFPEKVDSIIEGTLLFTLLLQAGIAGAAFLTAILSRMFNGGEEDPARSSALGLLQFLGHAVLWSVLLILFLDNLGVNITALVAGLGVGGIAVALAVQNVLGDLLGSLSIVLDKPFRIGDFIIVGDCLGTVERIGIKTTRIKSITGEQLVVSNSDLLSSRIRNFKRMYERRVVFEIGVTYQTPSESIRKIKEKLKSLVEELEDVRFDRAHFKKFGDSALVFEVVYFVLSADYNLYMDRQEQINLELLEYFNSEGFEFAYPTQTIFVENVEGPESEPESRPDREGVGRQASEEEPAQKSGNSE